MRTRNPTETHNTWVTSQVICSFPQCHISPRIGALNLGRILNHHCVPSGPGYEGFISRGGGWHHGPVDVWTKDSLSMAARVPLGNGQAVRRFRNFGVGVQVRRDPGKTRKDLKNMEQNPIEMKFAMNIHMFFGNEIDWNEISSQNFIWNAIFSKHIYIRI